ncbi:response regulator [Bacillus mangrovi]|uniref:histidine kinase n=1 Tax=Metabacillus mangrovi TaxID=1491830 RepID=A0A7X2S9G5_9BACI|nr:ATP-binding protein [Metabacillus mangrovi]MTH55658.1 response regulator [Metabacillus mangrovi]
MKRVKKSLTRQFSYLSISVLLICILLFAVFILIQNQAASAFKESNKRLNAKENLSIEIDYGYNLAISELRAYFSFGNGGRETTYKENMTSQQKNVSTALKEFEKIGTEQEDQAFIKAAQDFYDYYFVQTVPKAISLYESGNLGGVAALAQDGGSDNVRNFQNSMKEYRLNLDRGLEENENRYLQGVQNRQVAFVLILAVLLGIMSAVIRFLTKKISRPLSELTEAAGKIAAGQEVLFESRHSRDDELGVLNKAFEKMSYSIYEKEQDLNAQNEELIAQQDELQAQQAELEELLDQMRDREQQLRLRNDLINGISNTLDKQELLQSIISTLAPMAGADKAIIVLLNGEREYASSGVSEQEADHLLTHLESGFVQKLKETRCPFSVKRLLTSSEKGFHLEALYGFDLYVPIFTSHGELEAILLFTKYSQAFQQEEMENYMTLAKNITISLEKIRLYEQTEEERQLTQDMMNTVHEGIQLVDTRGTILSFNEKMLEMMTGWEQLPSEGDSFAGWISSFEPHIEEQAAFRSFFQKAIFGEAAPGGSSDSFTYQLRGVEGMQVVKVYLEPLYRMEHRIGTVIVHRDITKEYEVDKMKSEFVSTVSHELRTPLASVLGFTELMLHKELKPERQKKYLATILQEAKRLTSLINDFLDVQRMESGKQTYEKKYDDLYPLLQQIAELQQIQAPDHQIRIERSTEQTVVLGDREKLSQVFRNLVSNAVKYSPQGGSISIRLYEEEKHLNIAVKDDGLGIPGESMDKLFNKFYRVDNSDRRRIGGTGLGLAIVREIVKAHEGSIEVQSELGKGSTFTVRLPLIIQAIHEVQEESETHKAYTNVIIIEDDLNLANLLKTELEESRFRVEIFSSGKEALIQIREQRPDAVVLDIMLDDPAYTGWDLLKEVKNCDQLKHIPIFISSALEEKEKGLGLGADDYLIKPYQPGLLSRLILQTLLQRDLNGQILIPEGNK